MNAGRMAALVVWGLVATAVAAEPEAPEEDLSKQSTGLLQARMATEQKRLEAAEQELDILRYELQKARTRQSEARAQKLDTARVAPLLARFQRDFTEVGDVVNRGALPTQTAYARLERSSAELLQSVAFALEEYLPRRPGQDRSTPVLEELHGDSELPPMPAATELQVLRMPDSSGTTPTMFAEQMREAFASATERAKSLSMSELERLFALNQEFVVRQWQSIIDRAQAGIDARERQVKAAQESIERLSVAKDARKIDEIQNDTRMNWAVLMMIGALASLFIATRFFSPEVQAIIFQQRTLVEMMGMAFLLLTIIILGTNGKIEPAVLGTLLGTVGGYIFGQQVQARRGAGADAQAPAQPGAVPPARPVAPAQPAEAAPVQPVAAPPVAQSAALMQQAAQQGAPSAAEALPVPLAARVQQAVQQGGVGTLLPGAVVPAPLPPKEEPREHQAPPAS